MLSDLVEEGLLRENVELASMTTYKVGGAARWFLEATEVSHLVRLAPFAGPIIVVGRGSNLVVADQGFPGLVVHLGGPFGKIAVEGSSVRSGGAAALPGVARRAARSAVDGLGWMVGVPGSVGGAVRMNAGCFGSDVAGCLVSATVVDVRTGQVDERTPELLAYGYRTSNLGPHEIVTEATFVGRPGDQATVEAQMREVTRWRRDNQPGGTHNAGSVFKNPPDDAAGRIIDDLGLKGLSVGQVSVSEKHANFFVAGAGATAQDIYDLVATVRQLVRERTAINLVPEMVFVGFDE